MILRDDLLLALVPPLTFRPGLVFFTAFLKLPAGAALRIERSEFALLDPARRPLDIRRDAFGLTTATHLVGPFSGKLRDDVLLRAEAAVACWRLNDLAVEAPLAPLGTPPEAPRIVYLPLQVPLKEDCHVAFTLVNAGASPIDLPRAMQAARCWMDGVPYESTAGAHWDGSYLIRPQSAGSCTFRLSDFPGAPQRGRHETSIEILGQRSPPEHVDWRGEPWVPPRLRD
ncbi:hypothetical protein [Chondromyces apiculatus]|uniref:Uncharacterized protein n=1 Tax=Chondromyces apiculatus DSM 436 TaxID=1192034 RepID=A0A017T960_9BACT|nr:hypothetical protein [Chondromyces apiculatus]EYF05355.1 Hypothetical protein CAP_3272 [Chondromyces apiculatus DSM 436]